MTSVSIGWGDYVRLILVLCGILALAAVAIRYGLPRMSTWSNPAAGPIEVCARFALEPRKTLYIVKAANSYILLASSDAGVQHLTALTAEECAGLPQKAGATPPRKL